MLKVTRFFRRSGQKAQKNSILKESILLPCCAIKASMSRKLRVYFSGAQYDMVGRGNQKDGIFYGHFWKSLFILYSRRPKSRLLVKLMI